MYTALSNPPAWCSGSPTCQCQWTEAWTSWEPFFQHPKPLCFKSSNHFKFLKTCRSPASIYRPFLPSQARSTPRLRPPAFRRCMGKAISLLRPQKPAGEGEREAREMELRKRPRPRRIDPDFVSFSSPSPPRKRVRRQAAAKKSRVAARRKMAKCPGVGIWSPVAGLQPSRCCRAPPVSRVSFIPRSRVPFNWYDPDMWTEVAKHLHGTNLVYLSLTCRWFRRLLMDDSIWRYAFLRDLSLPTNKAELPAVVHTPRPLHRPWRLLYAAAFDESHAYCFRQPEKHIEWFRIGGFLMDTSRLLLAGTLSLPRCLPVDDDGAQNALRMAGACFLNNARRGIWIADMNLVRCPVCNLNDCKGTMQVLEARHCELFLEEEFRNGTWEYEDLGHHFIDGKADAASAAIVSDSHLARKFTSKIANAKSWIRRHDNLLPKAYFTPYAVALNSNLQDNDGLLSKFKAMRDMTGDGEIVSVRITQQLL